MLSIGEVAQRMDTLLEPVADRLAHETGWVRRRSKLTGPRFVQTLVLGWLRAPQASLEALCQTAASLGVAISPQGLDQRFGRAAADYLKGVLDAAVETILATDPVAIPLLQRFPVVAIEDSSTVTLPPALAALWAGCGSAQGPSGAAALKLQVRLDLCTGQLTGPRLADGRAADQRSGIPVASLPTGGLRIADLGYFSLETMGELSAHGVYWLSRLHAQTAVYDAAGERLELVAWLERHPTQPVDAPVCLGSGPRLPARLLAVPVPQAVADARRRKLRAALRDQGRTVSQARLALAGWTLLVTNAPAERMAVTDALVLYRVRWQIELLFKLWKQHGRIDDWRSAKPWRILCELYAKLVALLLQHWCLLLGCWAVPNRSWVKAAETIRAQTPVLACAMAGLLPLTTALEHVARTLAAGCRLNRRRTHPNAVHYLFEPGLAEPWLQAA
jgi:hypothetical protein